MLDAIAATPQLNRPQQFCGLARIAWRGGERGCSQAVKTPIPAQAGVFAG